MKLPLAKLLVRDGLVSIGQIREAIEKERESGRDFGESLVGLGFITEHELLGFLGRQYGVPVMDIESRSIDPGVSGLIPPETASEKCLIPVCLVGADLIVAMSDPSDIMLLDVLGFITGKHIIPVIAPEGVIRDKIAEYYGPGPDNAGPADEISPGEPVSSRKSILTPKSGGKRRPIDEIIRELEEYCKYNQRQPGGAAIAEGSLKAQNNPLAHLEDKDSNRGVVAGLSESPLPGDGPAEGRANLKIRPDAGHGDDAGIAGGVSREITPGIGEGAGSGYPEPDTGPSGLAEMPDGGEFSVLNRIEHNAGADDPGRHTFDGGYLNDVPSSADYGVDIERESGGGERTSNPDAKTEEAEPEWSPVPGGRGNKQITAGPGDTRGAVLIVDRSPTVRKIVAITLRKHGYSVHSAVDGMQALAKLSEVTPGLILIDINLPHMDGYQLCKVIRSHGLTKDIPVVMMSGKVGMVDKMKGRMAGASDYIRKPFESDAIVNAANRYMGSRVS